MERQYLDNWRSDDTLLVAHEAITQLHQVVLLTPSSTLAEALTAILGNAGYHVDHAISLDAAVELLASADTPLVAIIEQPVDQDSIGALGDSLRAATLQSIRILVVGDEGDSIPPNFEQQGTIDGYIGLPLNEPEVAHQVAAQFRAAQEVQVLELSRTTLLGTALMSMELAQSLRADLDTQRVLHHELLHRVQTHVGALRDYLELEVRRLPLGIAREAMRGVLHRVRSLSSMYETMTILGTQEMVEFGSLATKISQGVKAMYSPRSKLPVVVEGHLLLSSTSASPLTLVINELVTNAYRHAFPGGRFGTIRIVCGRDEERGWCVVSDDGVGIEVPLPDRPNSGIQLIQQLVRRSMAGHCTWERATMGTVVTVQFPLENP